MAQVTTAATTSTTVDLPDPMEGRPAPGAAGADDLLDQLAGDEIDRLLAGVDVDPPAAAPVRGRGDPAPAPPERHAADPAATAATPLIESEVITRTPRLADPSPAPMERLLARFDAPAAPEGLPEPPSFDAVVARDDAETSLAERGALGQADADEFAAVEGGDGAMAGDEPFDAEDAEAEAAAAAPAEDEVEAEPLPAYLRPLEWLNAPLDALPGSAREAVGKVAILALVNALAVLLYVLIFGR